MFNKRPGFLSWLVLILSCLKIRINHGEPFTEKLDKENTRAANHFEFNTVTFEFFIKSALQEFQKNGLEKIAIVSDSCNGMGDVILKTFIANSLQFMHLEYVGGSNDTMLAEWFYNVYVKRRATTFVLMTSSPSDVMTTAKFVFERHRHKRLFAMPHRTHWLVIVWSSIELNQFLHDQIRCVFDHVTVVLVSLKHLKLPVRDVVTLEWQRDRTRRPARLPLGQTRSCYDDLFPNRKFGMNGRLLRVITKPFVDSLFKAEYDNVSKTFHYSGFHVDLLNDFSRTLNMTYTFSLNPEDAISVPWETCIDHVMSGRADVGVNAWILDWPFQYQFEFTTPIFYDHVTGIYIRPTSSSYISMFLLCPYPVITWFFLAGYILYLSFLRLIIETLQLHQNQNITHASRDPQCSSKMKFYSYKLVSNICSFLMVLLNLGNLPRSHLTSINLLFGGFSLASVILYSVYTSFLTSEIVSADDKPPFTTYKEMMADGRFQWGVPQDSFIFDLLSNRTQERTAKELGNNMVVIPVRPGERFLENGLGRVSRDFVLIFYKHYIEFYMNEVDHPLQRNPRLTFMKETLMQSGMSYMLARHSELNEILSTEIYKLLGAGILQKRIERDKKNPPKPEPETKGYIVASFREISGLLVVVGSLAIVSFIVLLIEKILALRQTKCRKEEGD